MDGRQGAGKARRGAQFRQGQVGLAPEEFAHGFLVRREDERLASAEVVPRGDVAGVAALLEELFDHAQRNTVTAGDHIAGAFAIVIGSQYPFTQVQGERCHARREAWGHGVWRFCL